MSPSPSSPRRSPVGTDVRAGAAFTLVEMLIAVGAVALISVGLARLFASTGETVRVGRRISTLNEAAATLERQIRKDVASMTREGFLVIRHKNIEGTAPTTGAQPAGVLLSEDDTGAASRIRRADEILFFAAGRFTSMREPQYPTRQAVGNAARIYYGHGVRDRRLEDSSATGYLLNGDPIIDLDPDTLANWPELGQTGANEFASNWALLRHVTVLARPAMTEAVPPADAPTYASNPAQWRDSLVQVDLQPSAASIFRLDPLNGTDDIVGGGYRSSANANVRLPLPGQWARDGFGPVYPRFASGAVDVASVDLSLVRNRVLSLPERVLLKNPAAVAETFDPIEVIRSASPAQPNSTAHLMKMLMASALPSAPAEIDGPPNPTQASDSEPEQRMLWAPVPADFTGLVDGNARWPDNEPWRRQDQVMLTSTPIVVGCTEFIVEWSFGEVSPVNAGGGSTRNTGQLIWHGLPRWDDSNGNGRLDSFETAFAGPYRNQTRNTGGGWDGALGPDQHLVITSTGFARPAPASLIHWPTSVAFDTEFGLTGSALPSELTPLYSFFGYVDPTYSNSPYNPAQPTTLPWPWPRLLRFTVTLVDPSDPLAEQTYQFVVELPSQQQ